MLEALSFALSLICVWCNVRQIHWAWLFAILSSALYGVVFYQNRLYGDAGLQAFFVAASVWGWWQWRFARRDGAPLVPRRMSCRHWGVALLCWGATFAALLHWLFRYTDSDVPHLDALLTAGSIVAQFALARKFIENWLLWLVLDLAYIGLYLYKGLYLTALLYALFVVLCVIGWREWRRALESAPAPGTA